MVGKRDLFVIEAPGKIPRLTVLLASLSPNAKVVATSGHICAFPDDPKVLGLTPDGETPGRDHKPGIREKLLAEFSAPDVGRIVIATDDDDEGDVIARDVANLARRSRLPVLRMRLGAITIEAVRAALRDLQPITPQDAASGMTRVMLDRALGIGLSDATHGVGRVLTPMLELAARGEFERHPVDLVCPSEGQGMPFVGRLWLSEAEKMRLSEALRDRQPPMLPDDPVPARPPLLGTGELLVRIAEETWRDVPLVERMLQALYEGGRISYCRAYGAPLPRSAVAILARSAGWPSLPREEDQATSGRRIHPAPHLLESIPLGVDPARLSGDQATLVSLGRAQAEATLQDWRRPKEGPLEDWLARLGVERREGGPRVLMFRPVGRLLPWLRKRQPGMHSVDMPVSAHIVRGLLAFGLGRPSTYASHADGLLDRGLVDWRGAITEKGMRWLGASPTELRNPALSRELEALCRVAVADEEVSLEPWRLRFAEVMRQVPEAPRRLALAAMEAHGREARSGTLEGVQAMAADRRSGGW
jgi:DNA topoisomerase-1